MSGVTRTTPTCSLSATDPGASKLCCVLCDRMFPHALPHVVISLALLLLLWCRRLGKLHHGVSMPQYARGLVRNGSSPTTSWSGVRYVRAAGCLVPCHPCRSVCELVCERTCCGRCMIVVPQCTHWLRSGVWFAVCRGLVRPRSCGALGAVASRRAQVWGSVPVRHLRRPSNDAEALPKEEQTRSSDEAPR